MSFLSPASRVILLAAALVTAGSAKANLLTNGGFDSPYGSSTSISGVGSSGPSAAAGWYLYNNSSPLTTSELLASTNPRAGSGNMIHVTTGGTANGLYQLFAQQPATSASVDVFVLSGTVRFYLFTNGGLTALSSIASTTTGVWETLTLNLTSGNPYEIVLYSDNPSGANFYADHASVPAEMPVNSVPDGGLTVALLGIAGLFLFRDRRN